VDEMNRRQFALCGILITMALGAVIGWSISTENPFLALVAVIVAMALLYLCKTRVEEVLEDERIYRISEKASRRTFQVIILTIGLLGVVLITLGKGAFVEYKQIGLILAFSVCALLILYLFFYGYYSKRGLD
jgi:uncharacterized membrane protein